MALKYFRMDLTGFISKHVAVAVIMSEGFRTSEYIALTWAAGKERDISKTCGKMCPFSL